VVRETLKFVILTGEALVVVNEPELELTDCPTLGKSALVIGAQTGTFPELGIW
jgi:hypothetical protein